MSPAAALFDKRSVPVCTLTLPVLFRTALSSPATPVPCVRVSTPALLIVVEVPPKLLNHVLFTCTSKVPLLLNVPPPPAPIPPPLHVVNPLVVSVRCVRNLFPDPTMSSVFVPLTTVEPAPLIVPPLHWLPVPFTVNTALPASVPPLRFNAPDTALAALKFAVPPLMFNAPPSASATLKLPAPPLTATELTFIKVLALKFTVPELTLSAPLFVYAPVCVNAAPLTLNPPAPASTPPTLYVPPPKSSVAPPATV